ncbi:WD repeat-containing protein mio [Stylophora pistillata]|uniref:WD repeat-containing protein mio n=1 Tax=Stylophora pistillata TaxID=50429 RepID=A0A2B4SEZ4_STYPI|nr:WD repeat-containing protein mio [Stylophora pistillata]
MSTANWQVLWSPNQHDKFITFGSEICLYKVTRSQESPPKAAGARSQVIPLSGDTYASLLSVMNDIQNLKCVAWCPKSERENLLAVGQANGRVLVTCIGRENNQSNQGISREFVPRHSRQCNRLAWNPVENKLLAVGLDKARNDPSLLVWDVSVQPSVRDSGIQEKRHSGVTGGKQSPITVGTHFQDPSHMQNRALVELSTSETTVSLAWCPYDPNVLITGQGQKFIRVFDIRGANHLTFEGGGPPGIVCIWDDRNLEKPSYLNFVQLMTMSQSHSVTATAWSPTRSGLVTTLGKERPIVQLYDIQHTSVVSPTYGVGYEIEPSFIERSVKHLVPKLPPYLGLWEAFIGVLTKDKSKNLKYDGIKAIIGGENGGGGATARSKADSYQEQRLVAPVYFSDERKLALSLCGWDFKGSGNMLADFLNELQSSGQHERAAAVALFNNKIRDAIEILSSQGSNNKIGSKGNMLNVVAMALSGYTEEKNALWRDMCRALCGQMENPYLRSAFAFLTTEAEQFENILAEEGMEIEDRVAFACKFLPDNKLSQFLENLSTKLSNAGDLDGILLTGISMDGINLLEKYVNKTTDVQTASLVIVNCVAHISSEVSKDPRVLSWIENYRSLLDMWRLWHQRSLFDIHFNLKDSSQRPPQQVFVSCNFCGNSILTNMLPTGSRPRKLAQYCNPSNRTKIMACPGCRKPLPRCALCLVHMGTSSSLSQKPVNQGDSSAEKPTNVHSVNPFNNWFTWCQSCRHGGHSNHIVGWFKEHVECPVTGCGCHCMNLDSVATAMPNNDILSVT